MKHKPTAPSNSNELSVPTPSTWRTLALQLIPTTPPDLICSQVYSQFSHCFKGQESAYRTIRKFINANTTPTINDLSTQALTTMTQKAEDARTKELIKKKAIADFVIEGCLTALSQRPIVPPTPPPDPSPPTSQVAVLELSDIQAGTFISEESTGGLNYFNWERLVTYFDGLFQGISSLTLPSTLHIHLLGDIVEGSQIFPGQEQHICRDLFKQVIGSVELIENFLSRCLTIFDSIKIVAVCGNHGRVGKKGENPHWVNWDRIVYEFVRREFQDPRITWQLDDSWWQIDTIFSYNFYLTHGDDIRCWNGIPYYGVDRSAQRETELLRLHNTHYDYFCIGHLHTPAVLPGVATTKFINGCFPGGTIFSMKNMGVASKPQQWLLIVDEKWGVIAQHPIYLDRTTAK